MTIFCEITEFETKKIFQKEINQPKKHINTMVVYKIRIRIESGTNLVGDAIIGNGGLKREKLALR